MVASYLLFALSRPHSVPEDNWINFYQDEHIADLVSHGVVRNGALYKRVSNPMGRPPPDDKTYLALYETDFPRCLNTDNYVNGVKTTSSFFPGAPKDVADLDVRNYELVEVFDPKGVGSDLPAAKCILQAEADPADIEEFHRFYREDHAPMMSKHPTYRRTLHYRAGAMEGGQLETPNPIVVIHEFESWEGFGGPITNATLETPFARRVLPKVKSMKARALELVAPRRL